MPWKLAALLALLVSLLSTSANAATDEGVADKEDFLVTTTSDLLDLCTVPEQSALKEEAVHFCYGYLVGAYHYYKATASGPGAEQLVCLPEPPPSREAAISMFIEWAKAHPQYMNELPVETEFRFLTETWPCK